MSERLAISYEPNPSPETKSAINQGITDYNLDQIGEDDYAPFALVVRDDAGKIIGGLHAATFFGWLAVDLLWVDERLRGQGYGANLLREAERIGRERGCVLAYLNTFSFQAPDFYAAQGYTEFALISNPERGLKRHYFQKMLTASPEG